MIEYLHIQNLATVEDVEIELGAGLNVITGETGAGKSILVAGMSLLRGGRASAKILRSGADKAVVEALLRIPGSMVSDFTVFDGDEDETGAGKDGSRELVVSRVIARSGKGRIRVNGTLETAKTLSETLGRIVDLTGQREQQSIAEPANHRRVLDRFGLDPDVVAEYRAAYEDFKKVCAEMDAAVDPRERRLRMEVLAHQVSELRDAALEPGEEDRLEGERRRLASAVELRSALEETIDALYDRQGSVVELLGAAERVLDHWTQVEPGLGDKVGRLLEARSLVEDVAMELRSTADSCEMDPQRLEDIEERLLYLAGLERKHGVQSVAELMARRGELDEQLAALERFESRAMELDQMFDKARSRVKSAAHKVSLARSEAARKLESAVAVHLADLDMSAAHFSVRLAPLPMREGDDPRFQFGDRRAGPEGWDRVRFFLSANPGEQEMPVDEIASGGELSRILLAVKSATAASDRVLVYVFDEVDQGVGGRVADVLGKKLARVARHRQVLCVTHLPQIAAYADRHLRVTKSLEQGRAVSRIQVLDGAERVEELARMSGGSDISGQTLAHARDLLARAEAEKGRDKTKSPTRSNRQSVGQRPSRKGKPPRKTVERDAAARQTKPKSRRRTSSNQGSRGRVKGSQSE